MTLTDAQIDQIAERIAAKLANRPATGKNKIKLSASASPALIAAAAKAAAKKNESFSAYVARAIQTQLLNDFQ